MPLMGHPRFKYGPEAVRKGQYENIEESPTFEREAMVKINEPVGSATISPSSRDVALASNEGLHIIDLDNLYSPPRLVKHFTTGDVADVQWSPFASRDSWIISTTNQKALVWNLNMRQNPAPIEYVLQGHTRAITDINFSAHHPDVLATCSVDASVACWDLRDAGRPSMKFSHFQAGATQVKWNRQDSHIIASSHDSELLVWDSRLGTEPLWSVKAHRTRIYGIDWNRTRPSAILTCSLDRSIKLWDYASSDGLSGNLERIIYTPFPVWRARHTPFGWGILAMPQRDSNDLHLYDRRLHEGEGKVDMIEPVCNFSGHTEPVKEFLWRSRGGITGEDIDEREFQLVSWGRDKILKLHRLRKENLKAVGFEKGKAVFRRLNLTRKGAAYNTFTEIRQIEDEDLAYEATQPLPLGGQRESALTNLIKGEARGTSKHAPIIPYPQGFGSGMSYLGPARLNGKKEENVISWMKNVSVARREWDHKEIELDAFGQPMPKPTNGVYDDIEDLGEEITQVGDKFKKITFEDANIARRYAIIFLQGPWGDDSGFCPIRVTINFPPEYPRKALPRFSIDETSSLKKETSRRLCEDLQEIANFHLEKSQGCLDNVVMYLLGERTKEGCMTSLEDSLAEGDSSSDEGDESGIIGGMQEMEASGGDILPKTTANVPVAATCTAKWASDGRLITIFMSTPSGPSEPQSQFSDILRRYTRASIGRLSKTYGLGRPSSSSSESSSSDAELTSNGPSAGWLRGHSRPQHAKSADSSQLTGGGDLQKKSSQQQEQTTKSSRVAIFDLVSELPPLNDLAEQYTLIGKGKQVCEHNRDVAASLGYFDHAHVWSFLELVFEESVPLQLLALPAENMEFEADNVPVVAKRTLVEKITRGVSTVFLDGDRDIAFDDPKAVVHPKLTSRVKWGNHPFGGAYSIPQLFQYYESQHDTLMLGMMATVLAEPTGQGPNHSEFIKNAPGFSLDYVQPPESGLQGTTTAMAGSFDEKEFLASYQAPVSAITNLPALLEIAHEMYTDVDRKVPVPTIDEAKSPGFQSVERPLLLTIEHKNQDRFEDEGSLSTALLSTPGLADRCKAYRSICGELLRSFKRYNLAAEMDKIGGLKLKSAKKSDEPEEFAVQRETAKVIADPNKRNISNCSFCWHIIDSLCITCTVCGSGMHHECAIAYGDMCPVCEAQDSTDVNGSAFNVEDLHP
ncbi:MAG: hypothetical protein M1820_007434 [Bogoriella megaspora]|nr:MAG: hypothetical protein M1820_007434 [Bogoriella megaspora]